MKKLDVSTVIKRPIVTERSTLLRETQNKVVLEVYPHATKDMIKAAVESAFKVSVLGVNTMKVPSKITRARMGKGMGTSKKANWKKAVVTLKQGDKIELFEGV